MTVAIQVVLVAVAGSVLLLGLVSLVGVLWGCPPAEDRSDDESWSLSAERWQEEER